MPPTRRFTKEEIIDVAYKIVQNSGLDGLNARLIAQKLGCSVQPIFHNFSSMEELEKEVYDKIYDKYREYLLSGKEENDAYKKTGLAYIQFAKDFPNFFKLMFMNETSFDIENFIMSDSIGEDVIKIGQTLTGFTYEEQKRFHAKVWVFTHGIACLTATNTVKLSDEEIEQLLTTAVREMAIGQKIEKEKR